MNNQTAIKGIIFDLGGVIVEAFGQQFLIYASQKLGVSVENLEEVVQKEEPSLQRSEITSIQFWQRICKELGVICPNEEILQSLWVKPYEEHAKIKEDTLKLIQKLKGNYKLAILSNTIYEHNEINKQRKLYDNFDAVLLSNKLGMRKPEKRFFDAVARKLNLSPEELLFVDDEMRWVVAARNYGLKAILFESAEQLEQELEKLGCVRVK